MSAARAYYLSYQDPVARWANNVSRNGASVSPTRVSAMRRFVEAEKRIGADRIFDEYWFPWGENETQGLVSFKLGLVGQAVNSPTWTANQGYTGDGLSAYVRLGFIPSVHGRAMSGGRARVEVYIRTNAGGTMETIGVTGGGVGIRFRPRTGSDTTSSAVMSALTASATAVTDSRGLKGTERNGTSALSFDGNGTALADATAGTLLTILPTREFFLLAQNNNGTAATFDSRQVGYAAVGAPMVDAALKAAHYANVQQLATDIGANV